MQPEQLEDIPQIGASDGLETIPGIVWAFRIDPQGIPAALDVRYPIDLHHSELLWLHLNLSDARTIQWLKQANLGLPEQARTMLVSHDTFQQIHVSDDTVFGVISDLLRDFSEDTDQTGYLRFAIKERFLISGRHQALSAVDATRRALEGGHRVESGAMLFETIVEHVADTMDSVADRIALSLDDIEERILTGGSRDTQRLGRMRRTCVRLHRQLSGMRTVLVRLERDDLRNLKSALQLRAAKLLQRLDSLDHRIVEMRERSRLLQEELHLIVEEQGNESIRLLSVLTALLLPPTLVTGIFGMNTKGLPFTDVETGFLWAAGLMLASSLAAYLLLRRLGLTR